MDLVVIDNPPQELVSELDDRIYEFNVAATGISDGRLLAILVKDSRGSLIAGLSGHTWGGTCEVRLLWVAEAARGRGLGARLLQAAEGEARSRGCNQIVLSTHSFQAPGFYAKFGFREAGRVHDYPRGHDSIYLRKQL
jgi:GNAT superfamily N-acetyltransferase